MAYIQTINGGFTQDDKGNMTPYSAPGSSPVGGGGGNLPEDSNMFGGFDAGSQSANMAQNQMAKALNFVNNLPSSQRPGGSQNLIPGLPANPYQSNPTGTDMIGGTQGLNPRNFASLEGANALAKQLGANVTATNYEDAMRSPEYNLDFGRGSALNAGQLMSRYNTNDPTRDKFWDSEYWRNKSLEDELRYNSSPMENDIRNDRSGQMGQIQKDVAGGYQSFKPGGSAGSFSDASSWGTTGPSGQQFAPGGPQAGQLGSNGQPYGQSSFWNQFQGGAGPSGPGMGGSGGGRFGGPASGSPGARPFGGPQDGIGGGGNPYAGTGGPTPPPPGMGGGGGQGGSAPFTSQWPGMGGGQGQGGGMPPFGGWGSGYQMGGGGMQMPYGNLSGFMQLMNSVNQMRNQQPMSPQRRPQFQGSRGGFGGQQYGNGYYYPQMTSGFGRGYY